MLPALDTYDWEEAFAYAQQPQVVLGGACDDAGFTREDVAAIIAIENGENDGPAWIGLFALTDGRFAYLEAGCDYTGWDCQSEGFSQVASTVSTLLRFGVGERSRRRFGLMLPEDLKP